MELSNIPKVRFEKTQLVIDESISQEEWEDLGKGLKKLHGRIQFYIGDWARFGDKQGFTGKYLTSQTYDKLEEITGYDRGTLKNFKSVAEKTSSSRSDDLSFHHHKIVSSLPVEEQKKLLGQASKANMSTRELQKKVVKFNLDHKKEKATREGSKGGSQKASKPLQVRELTTAHRLQLCDLPLQPLREFEKRIIAENMSVETLRKEVTHYKFIAHLKEEGLFDIQYMCSLPDWEIWFKELVGKIVSHSSQAQLSFLSEKINSHLAKSTI